MLLFLPLLVFGCNSLLSELDRIRHVYDLKNSETPAVVATDPADGGTGSTTQNFVGVTFSTAVDPASATVQASTGACSGSLQFSTDDFATCIGGSLDTATNPVLRFTSVSLPRGVRIRLRVLATVTNTYGKPAQEYTSPQGFSFSTFCGDSNCFFSTSLPLLTPASTASVAFRIRSGAYQNYILVLTAGQTTTTLMNPFTLSSNTGPALPSAPTAGLLTFPVTLGPDAGKEMVLLGGTQTCLYDPGSHSFVAGPGLPVAVAAGAFTFAPLAGSHAGKQFIFAADTGATVLTYDSGGGFTTYGNTAPDIAGVGGHALRLSATTDPSYYMVVMGGSTTKSWRFDENTGILSSGLSLAGNVGAGGGSFGVTSGPLAGRILTILGGGSNATSQINVSMGTVEGFGPTLSQNVNTGGQLLYRYGTRLADAPLVIHGGLLATTTSRFDPDTGTFSSGPATHGLVGSGSSILYVPGTDNLGYFFIVNGLANYNTQIYSISSEKFAGNTLPGTTPNAGAHAFYISSGIHAGRTLVIAAGGTRQTAIYDPAGHAFYNGPATIDTISSSGFGVPITSGPYAGRVVVFAGGGSSTYNVYDPDSGTFKSQVELGFGLSGIPVATGTGASAFEMTDGRILITNGGSTTTQIIDPQSYSFVTSGTPTTGCAVSEKFNLRYVRPSDSHSMQLVWCSGNQFTVFDHTAQSFTPFLGPTGNPGLQAFVIASGAQSGNIVLVHGGGTDWSILSAEDLSVIGGTRSLSSCTTTGVNTGSQVIAITTGNNAGKHLLVVGNSSRVTCLFDPQTEQFISGPPVNAVDSPGYYVSTGSVVFATRGGQYPTGSILLSGTNKNVWSTFVP